MLLGKTDNLQEQTRIAIKKRISFVTNTFLVSVLLPFLVYALFHFNVVSGKSAFTSDIQEPVAKVVTGSGVGTAFLISPTILLTARHVVENYKVGDQVDLIFEHSKNKLQVKATIKYISTSSITSINGTVPIEYFLSDIAVLEVSEISDIEPLVLGESDAVQNLDDVILIGYPNGDYSITKGNINSDKFQGLNLFKLDATSNPGNSGGPCILKDDNTVIGILVGGSTTSQQGENIALKINDVKRILLEAKIVY
ncbi:MAG: serine protease [Flavobacterium sp. JAD_PAG50586_2]|nr:MAG: serine protease [Flavobacterium sp. JAD_PAG50586_2]